MPATAESLQADLRGDVPPGPRAGGGVSHAQRKAGVRLFQGADGVLLADVVPPEAIFRALAADNQRGHYTEVLAELGADRRLQLGGIRAFVGRDSGS